MNRRLVTLCAAQAGSAYDFTVYAFLAPVLTNVFFPHNNRYTSLIFIFMIFFIGFLARPIGGIIFGHLGDKGNKHKTVTLSVLTLGIPTFMMALLPSYHVNGYYAGILLLILRILQGLSLGGEFTGMMVILSESASTSEKYFRTSFAWTGALLGTLISSTIVTIMHHLLSSEEMAEWGWRIPFLFGLILIIVGVILRKSFNKETTPAYKKNGAPFISIIKCHKLRFLQLILVNMQMIALMYFSIIFYPTYLIKYMHLSSTQTFKVLEFSLILLLILIPFFSKLADKIQGEKILYFSTAGLTITAYPLLNHIEASTIYFIQIIMILFTSATLVVIPHFLVKHVDQKISYSLISIPYNVAASLIGGSLSLLSTLLIKWSGNLIAFT